MPEQQKHLLPSIDMVRPEVQTKSTLLQVLVALVVIAGVLLILSMRVMNLVAGVLFCISAYGLNRRKQWAGYLAGTLAVLGGLVSALNLIGGSQALFSGTMDMNDRLLLFQSSAWIVGTLAIIVLLIFAWYQLKGPESRGSE